MVDRFGKVPWCKEGDRIRFKSFGGHIFRLKNDLGQSEGDYYQVINDEDVLTIIEESEDV